MNIPEEFGSYLLLKKLSEDALGESFRAAKVGARGLEQVSLLRVLNGKGIDGNKLWQKMSNGTAIQAALRSPNIGNGVDVGRVRNQPYVAYDYISGKNLATVFEQTERRMSPIPTDHALLIAERVALALAVAAESRVGDQRVLHGCVVPHLVMVSNEGEARLLGFEIGAGLREVGGVADPELSAYLAPEAVAGAPVAKADDCWSLGAILFELLTGERMRHNPPEGYAARVEQTVLAHDGSPIPSPVADLIKKSLEPREQRIADAGAWHKAIAKLMSDGHFSPTTFNLAFFMHNLFRDDIEKENQELSAEKNLDLRPASAATIAIPIVPAAAVAASSPPARTAGAAVPPPAQAAASGSKTNPMIYVAAAVVLLALVGGGAWFMMRGKATPAAAPPSPAVAVPAPAAPAMTSETQAQIQAQIDQLVQAQIQASESKLKTQYDDRLKQLQKQLEDSRRPGASASPAAPSPAAAQEAPEPEPRAATSRPVEPTPAPASSNPAPAQAQPVAPEPAPARATPVETAPAPAPAPAAPRVQVGDLVRPGPGVQTPKLLRLPQPNYPAGARRLNKAATVDVRVLVDERGKVLETEPPNIRAGFGFDEAAVDVARRATYNPATKEGVRVKMWTVLRVAFKP
ncbi:MAG TPA: TonB family protein [Thermoanaerobaculia bacterium]|jgi:TonB family protein|nr:TonB family protein [Thermoanaerobaculia bacterium]